MCIWVNEKVCGDNGSAVVIYLWDKAEVWRLSQKTGVFFVWMTPATIRAFGKSR